MNYIDLIFIIVLVLYMIRGYQQGFWILIARFATFIGGLIAAIGMYQAIGRLIIDRTELSFQYAYVISFIGIFILTQAIISLIFRKILERTPLEWHQHIVNRILGIAPAFLDAIIFIALIVSISIMLPVPQKIKDDITGSYIGSSVINTIPTIEDYSRRIFGNSIEESLSQFAVRPNPDETVRIPFKPKTLSIDEESEQRILELINEERVKAGVKPVVLDRTITEVARKHSRDMWMRQYFAHNTPEGKTPFQRMDEGGIRYTSAGENLAFAPTVGVAHKGLMNSPGHKRNILDPNYGRVGIGVISGGVYGKMFTQNFAN
jgi:uncharacterized protein YkwD